MSEQVVSKRIRLILWALFAVACSLPLWWPFSEPATLPHFIPLYKLWYFDRFGIAAFLSDLLIWLVPLVPAGVLLALLSKKTKLYMAMLLGFVLGLASLLTTGGAFVTDAAVYGLIGSALGFSAVALLQKSRDSSTRGVSAAFFISCYVFVALLMVFGGGSHFGRLHFTSKIELPESISVKGELPADKGSVPLYTVNDPNGIEAKFDSWVNVEPVNYTFEQWDEIGSRELKSMSDLLPDAYALEAVTKLSNGYRLNYSTAVNGHPVSGYELIVEYDLCGTPQSIRSPITGFTEHGTAAIFDAATTLDRLQAGSIGYTLLCEKEPLALEITEAVLAYRDDSTTGCLLPYWSFGGTATAADGSTFDFILYAEAMK